MSDQDLPTAANLMQVATRYLAQRAASTQHLRQLLLRRMRRQAAAPMFEVENAAELAPLVDDVIARLTEAGLLDDSSYAASRARVLAAKGFPPWRVRRELANNGLEDPKLITDVLDSDVQARRFAERKRLGPFRVPGRRDSGDKDLRALLRAGFSLRIARRVLHLDEAADSAAEMNAP